MTTALTPIESLLSDEPFYVAHRCGGGTWPEFSERGVAGSLARGYRALEVSVYRCETGEYVASHDATTERMTGSSTQVGHTPWSALGALTSTPAHTTDPTQSPTALITLEQIMHWAPDAVLFLDHKATSSGPGNEHDRASEADLFDHLDSLPGATGRIVWKVFKAGWESAQRARERGYPVWGIYYDDEVVLAPTRAEHFDLVGLNWDATPAHWSALVSLGKPTVGHIITTPAQRDQALQLGANGIMNSNVGQMP